MKKDITTSKSDKNEADILKMVQLDATRVEEIFVPGKSLLQTYPLFLESVSAGFPSPADDYMQAQLDLNEFIIKHPAATFFVRVKGDSMNEAGIFSGDVLVVDKALNAKSDNIVIAVIDGDLLVKRLQMKQNQVYLVAENPTYKPIKITPEMNFEVWGVVTTVIHKLI